MCDKVVKDDPYSLQYVPDWFVTQQLIDIWDDDDYAYNDYLIEWYDSYKKRKGQEVQIKKELITTTWHPSSYWDWCMSEDEKKKKQKNCGHKHGLFFFCI